MTKRKLTTALTARIKVAVPCTASDPASVQAALDAIRAIALPPGSSVEFVGEPQFGKVEKPSTVTIQFPKPTADQTEYLHAVATSATHDPDATVGGPSSLPELPSHLDRRVPRHAT